MPEIKNAMKLLLFICPLLLLLALSPIVFADSRIEIKASLSELYGPTSQVTSEANFAADHGTYKVQQLNRDIATPEERMPRTIGESFYTVNQRQGVSSTPAINTHSLHYSAPPDLTVSADPGQQVCDQVSFTVNLIPSTTQPEPSGDQAVRARVIDKSTGYLRAVAEVLLLLPASGGSSSATVGIPTLQAATSGQNLTREIIVIVDPDNEVTESNESNNSVTITSSCSA